MLSLRDSKLYPCWQALFPDRVKLQNELSLVSILTIEQIIVLHIHRWFPQTSACYGTAGFHSANPLPTAHSTVPSQSRGNHTLCYRAGHGFTRLIVVSTTMWLSHSHIWKERKQPSLSLLGHFAQATHLHRWQQIAARIEAGHDYSHISWSCPSREPHWLNPEGQD